MTTKQREASALREDFMRLAGKTFRMGYEAIRIEQGKLAGKASRLYADCRAAVDRCAKLEALAKRLR